MADHESAELKSPSGAVVYEAILAEGENELKRENGALFWSGLAAGLSMGFSFLGTALLHAHLPADAKWAPLITAFGYSLGFVIVILGRQQLFTENTLTVVLPLLNRRRSASIAGVLRLWSVVLIANVLGAIAFALALAKTEAVTPETFASLETVAAQALSHPFAVVLLRGIFAGWLVALIVWLLPFAETARVFVIILLTWIIGAAHFVHVIAGAVEAAFLVFAGHASVSEAVFGFFLPALIGNVIGGVSLVAAINHAQIVGGGDAVDA